MKTHDLYRRQDRWEVAKAMAMFLAVCALMVGTIIGLSHWLHPASDQPRFPPGTVITIPPAKP